jgi:PleD family two-component response regulator
MLQRARILLADENDLDNELCERYLASVDCDIAVATDGLETLEQVQRFQPDLVLLDATMPKVSGFEICRRIKGNPLTCNTMILMVTDLNGPDDVKRAVSAGTDDFLCKPVNKVELVKRVENLLKLRHIP